MRMALSICACFAAAVAFASMIVGYYFWIRATFNRRPEPSRRWYVTANHMNAALFEDELTPQGLKYRTKAFRAGRIALISFVVVLALSLFIGD